MGDFTTYLPYLITTYLLWNIFYHISTMYVSYFPMMFDAGDFLVASQAIDFTLPEESYLSRIEVGNSEDISDIPICTFTHINIYIYIMCVVTSYLRI